jgi:hypothetical protein
MRHVFSGLILALGLGASSASALTIDCSITNYFDYPYTRAILEPLLPERQRHVIDGSVARYGDAVGEVYQNDDKRLKWRYTTRIEQQAGMSATIDYTIIRPKGVLIIRVRQGGNTVGTNMDANGFAFVFRVDAFDIYYLDVKRVSGACTER